MNLTVPGSYLVGDIFFFLFFEIFRQDLGAPRPQFNGYRVYFPPVKRMGCEFGHSCASTAEITLMVTVSMWLLCPHGL